LKILKILYIEPRQKGDLKYYRTYALLESGEVATGYGKDFAKGDKVQVFFHDKYNTIKMRKNS
jgi:hypothetical protein